MNRTNLIACLFTTGISLIAIAIIIVNFVDAYYYIGRKVTKFSLNLSNDGFILFRKTLSFYDYFTNIGIEMCHERIYLKKRSTRTSIALVLLYVYIVIKTFAD